MDVWVIVAEYASAENTSGCSSPDEYFELVGAFEDQDEAIAAAETERASGEWGDFGGKEEWSDCGWWLSVRGIGVTKSKKAPEPAAKPVWGIPRRRNLKRSLIR